MLEVAPSAILVIPPAHHHQLITNKILTMLRPFCWKLAVPLQCHDAAELGRIQHVHFQSKAPLVLWFNLYAGQGGQLDHNNVTAAVAA